VLAREGRLGKVSSLLITLPSQVRARSHARRFVTFRAGAHSRETGQPHRIKVVTGSWCRSSDARQDRGKNVGFGERQGAALHLVPSFEFLNRQEARGQERSLALTTTKPALEAPTPVISSCSRLCAKYGARPSTADWRGMSSCGPTGRSSASVGVLHAPCGSWGRVQL
jgi:hypothetical protein